MEGKGIHAIVMVSFTWEDWVWVKEIVVVIVLLALYIMGDTLVSTCDDLFLPLHDGR